MADKTYPSYSDIQGKDSSFNAEVSPDHIVSKVIVPAYNGSQQVVIAGLSIDNATKESIEAYHKANPTVLVRFSPNGVVPSAMGLGVIYNNWADELNAAHSAIGLMLFSAQYANVEVVLGEDATKTVEQVFFDLSGQGV
jgi:hypothetical protein